MGYLPSVRLELLRSRAMFEFEVGADKGRRQVPLQVQSPLQVPLPVLLDTQTSTQFYFSLGYRLGF
jgi:hypothetical protein